MRTNLSLHKGIWVITIGFTPFPLIPSSSSPQISSPNFCKTEVEEGENSGEEAKKLASRKTKGRGGRGEGGKEGREEGEEGEKKMTLFGSPKVVENRL